MRANDAIAGLVLILFAAAMITLTASFPEFPGQRYGPSLFPRLLGSGLIVCGGLLIWRGLVARQHGARWLAFAPWAREPRSAATFLLVIGLVLLYILLSESIGFIPLSSLSLAVLLLWVGVRPRVAVAVSLSGALLMYWFFASLLRVPLPRGWLDAIL